jgi:hypothetical protein
MKNPPSYASRRPSEGSRLPDPREHVSEGLVAGLTAAERARVLPVLQAASRRSEQGNYTFTDRASVDVWDRQGQPTPSSLGYKPGLETQHSNDVAAARKVMESRGRGAEFDTFVSDSNRRFLERRRGEEAKVKGDTVGEMLDWVGSAEEAKYLSQEVGKAADWLKAQRLAEIAKQPFFKRMGSKLGRVRSYFGNDHPAEHIDVMAEAVKLLNAQGPREELTGAQLLAALRTAYPKAFAPTGAENAVVPPTPESN